MTWFVCDARNEILSSDRIETNIVLEVEVELELQLDLELNPSGSIVVVAEVKCVMPSAHNIT